MRYGFAIAGLAAAASAGTTLTSWQEVTVTSCGPEKTNCPQNWGQWQNNDDNSKKTLTITVDTDDSAKTWLNWGDEGYATTEYVKKGDGQVLTWAEWTAKPTAEPSTWSTWNDQDTTSTWSTWVEPQKPKTVTYTYTTWVDVPNQPKQVKTVTETITTEWQNQPVQPASTGSWSQWSNAPVSATTQWQAVKPTYACPAYTDSAPPAWYNQLPAEVYSAMASEWQSAPPKDWCYYSYSQVAAATQTWSNAPVNAASTWSNAPVNAATTWSNYGSASTPVAAASTWAGVSAYTGGAAGNTVSLAFGGVAAIAAILLA